jgi:hypothetical protein
MSSRRLVTALTAGAFVAATLSIPLYAGVAQDRAGVMVVAENKPEDKNKLPPKQGPVRVTPNQGAPRVMEHHVQPSNGGQQNIHVQQQNIQVQKRIEIQKNVGTQKNIGVQKNLGPKIINPTPGTAHIIQNNTGGPKTAHKVFTPKGKNAGVVITAKIRSAPARGAFRTSIRGRNYSVWRSGYRARYHGGWRTFVALSALGAITIGAYEYYPYAYIDAPQDYCDGLTEDGCQMVYDDVETEEGDIVPQCVAYCPWQ